MIRVREFGGMIPKIDDKMLPENCATDAINVDLQGMGIEPMYAPLFKRVAGNAAPLAAATIAQFPTACLATVGALSAASYVSFPPIGGNYLVVANDLLIYSVFLPAGTTLAGQGAVNLHFTSGATLGNINDQNAIGSFTGDVTAQAQGQWYVRVIPLATAVGLTIDELRLYHNYSNVSPRTAYFGSAYVWNSGTLTFKKVLFDVDQQSVGTPVALGFQSYITTIDEDEAPLVSSFNYPANVETDRLYSLCQAQLSGFARNKVIEIQNYPQSPSEYAIRGWSNHDRFVPYTTVAVGFGFGGGVTGLHSLGSRHSWLLTGGQVNAIGWMGINRPTVAMSLAVVGGAAPVVTRSYVYTRVSEDGLESAPSPPVTVTGNRDGTWQLTNITSWVGTDTFSGTRNPAKKRVYRTPEGSETYRFVAEILATVTNVNDLALDAALGEDLATAHYDDAPQLTHAAAWTNGIVGGIAVGTQVCFSDPYQYHAWPQVNRYTIPYVGVATAIVGDRFVALTLGKPVLFSGSRPDELAWAEAQSGEPCISPVGVAQADGGVFYPGRTGWGAIDGGGYQNVSADYLTEADYAAIVGVDTVSFFDNRKLYWITQGNTTGYALERGAGARALTKFEVPDPIYAMSFYAPRAARWIAYTNGGSLKIGKLFADTATRLKWTWRSKLHRTPNKLRFKVGQIESVEWDSLSNNMKYREGFYRTIPAWLTGTAYLLGDFVTQGGNTYRCDIAHTAGVFATDLAALKWILTNAAYTINTAGLTQAELWCYLKIWLEADKSVGKTLVYDDFVVNDTPFRLLRAMKSDSWQYEIRGNIAIEQIAIAESEQQLNQE